MAINKKKKNIIRYRRRQNGSSLVSLLVFSLIVLYLFYNIYIYIMDAPTATYEVQQGTIVTNNVYKGLILRNETVVYADTSGYINYYIKSGSKAAVTDPVYSIDTDGSISKVITSAAENGTNLDSDDRSSLLSSISSFVSGYDSGDFENVYSFKQDFSSELNQDFSVTALNQLGSSFLTSPDNTTFYLYYPETPGIIAYYVDGYENLTIANYEVSDMDSTGYKKETLDDKTEVNKSDPVYKIVTSEEWNIIINISDEFAESLEDSGNMKIRLCSDDYTTTASYTRERNGNNYFLNLKLKNGMIRYLSDRFTEIELVADQEEGLKVPKTALTQKEFYAIPKECFTDKITAGQNNNLLVCGTGSDPVKTSISVYSSDDTFVYVSEEAISAGTIVQYPDSQKTYEVGTDTGSLDGVFNVNKGYATYRLVNILSENDEYAIVEAGTAYGISLYDHIVLDASDVSEGDMVTE